MRWLWGITLLAWLLELAARHGLAWSGAGQIVLAGGGASRVVALLALLWLALRLWLVLWTAGLVGLSVAGSTPRSPKP